MPTWTKAEYKDWLDRQNRPGIPAKPSPSNSKKAIEKEGMTISTVHETTDVSKLNKTERAFYDLQRVNADNLFLGVQCLTFKLGDDCRYTPDFIVIRKTGAIAYEVKGFMRDDALVKLKTAARSYPFFKFIVVTKSGSQWSEKEIKA